MRETKPSEGQKSRLVSPLILESSLLFLEEGEELPWKLMSSEFDIPGEPLVVGDPADG